MKNIFLKIINIMKINRLYDKLIVYDVAIPWIILID